MGLHGGLELWVLDWEPIVSNTQILVWLEPQELLLLDGKTSVVDTQKRIDEIKNETAFGKDKGFILKVIAELETNGRIGFGTGYVSCEICGKRSSIANYKSGRRKNHINYAKSVLVNGVCFSSDSVRFQGRPRLGICDECYARIKEELTATLRPLCFDYSAFIKDCPYRKDDERLCHRCNQPMYESEMGRQPTLMGGGTYPGECPKCGAATGFFGPNHQSTGKWRIIEKGQS
jgi:hypothetical protein